jgi:hypothetical protein
MQDFNEFTYTSNHERKSIMTTTERTTTVVDGAIVATVDEQGKVLPIVLMLDELVHTESNNYRCRDHTCPCYPTADERRNTAALNGGGRPFSLLK